MAEDKKAAPKTAPITESKVAAPETKSEPKADSKPNAAPSNYSRGEGQKPVSKAYKDNWEAIYGKNCKPRKQVNISDDDIAKYVGRSVRIEKKGHTYEGIIKGLGTAIVINGTGVPTHPWELLGKSDSVLFVPSDGWQISRTKSVHRKRIRRDR